MGLVLPILALLACGLAISFVVTHVMIHVAPRLGFVDKPGGRKIHELPKPLGGGVGIVVGLVVPLMAALVAVRVAPDQVTELLSGRPDAAALIAGVVQQTPTAIGFLLAILVLFAMGLWDDRRALGPYSKLVVQLLLSTAVVVGLDVRVLSALDASVGGPWLSILLTVLWITAITNAFNFLDNMDGLSAGVAAICTTAMLVAAMQTREQWFVAATLACLVGSLVGFLIWNFPPARIFMGDAGSLVIGFVLAVLSVRTTFLPEGVDFDVRWYAVFAPLIALALPIYDLLTVSIIRIRRGKSPFQGDKNHFSHRLVERGMSRRTAVLCLYLVTAATSIAAVILPGVRSDLAATLLVCQTLLVLGVVALLEQHGRE